MKYITVPITDSFYAAALKALKRIKNGQYAIKQVGLSREITASSKELASGTFLVDINFQKDEEEIFRQYPELEADYMPCN